MKNNTNTERYLQMPAKNILSELKTSPRGLSSEKAKERLKIYGHNEFIKKERKTVIIELLSHFKNPFIIILIIAGIITAIVGEKINASIIFVMVVLSISLDFYQEFRAKKAAEMLQEKVANTAAVMRDGKKQDIRLTNIVPGDIIFLSAGDIIPADARVIEEKNFFVDQSVLTGESFPVEKNPDPIKGKNLEVTEWENYIFMGTSVISGTATAVVIKTGGNTEYGDIVKKIMEKKPETEFETGLKKFGYLLMKVIFFLVLFVFFVNVLFKRDFLSSFLFAVALTVGLTPELLPMILSVTLSRGAIAMSKKGVIVKHLPSIQNLGSMDVLCTDKTGTLTENRVELLSYIDYKGKKNDKVLLYSYLNSYYQSGLKNPLDEELLKQKGLQTKDYKKIDEIPFDFTRRRLSVSVGKKGRQILITKGAPEEIIKACTKCEIEGNIQELNKSLKKKIELKYNELSKQGLRIIGVAYKEIRKKKAKYTIADEENMTFLGFLTFFDPPKKTAKESLKLLEKLGIDVKIITGDNELVTKTTCEQLDLKIKGILMGSEIEKMTEHVLAKKVEKANIFVRVTPSQKERIVAAIKKNGHVVGFLGDGINDVLSLRAADVGISVNSAVDVAKESAEMILSHKSLEVLKEGVLDGRKTFGNTMKYIMMGTSSNFGNMFSAAGASLFLKFLPMLPTQILLNNFLYDISELTLPTDRVDDEYTEKPKKWDIAFIQRFMLVFGGISSLFDFLTYFIMLMVFKAPEPLFQTAWFIESLATQTLVIFAIRTRKSLFKGKPSIPLTITTLGVVAFASVIPLMVIGKLFGFVEPPAILYVVIGVLVCIYLLLVETTKKWFYKRELEMK
jgi:Mg2+-importing ATPase